MAIDFSMFLPLRQNTTWWTAAGDLSNNETRGFKAVWRNNKDSGRKSALALELLTHAVNYRVIRLVFVTWILCKCYLGLTYKVKDLRTNPFCFLAFQKINARTQTLYFEQIIYDLRSYFKTAKWSTQTCLNCPESCLLSVKTAKFWDFFSVCYFWILSVACSGAENNWFIYLLRM